MNRGLRALLRGADCPAVHGHPPPNTFDPRLAERGTVNGEEVGLREPKREAALERAEVIPDDKAAPNARELRLQESRHACVEAHDPECATVITKRTSQRRRPPPDVILDLDLQQERHATIDERKEAFERRHRMLSDAETRQLAPAALPDPHRAGADAHGVGIVEDHNPIVCCQPEIALNARAFFQRGGECDQAILGECRTEMQSAVGETDRTGIERVRP